jgi:hypothetical protein
VNQVHHQVAAVADSMVAAEDLVVMAAAEEDLDTLVV